MDKSKVGIAPIGWTNDDMPELGAEISFDQCINEMAKAGYFGTEVGNKFPKDPVVLKNELAKRGLRICNRWVSLFLISRPFEEVFADFKEQVAFLKAVGAKIVGVSEQSYSIQGLDKPVLGENEGEVSREKYIMNESEWKALCEGLNKLGEYALSEGLTLAFHHHMGTVVQTVEETDRLMRDTGPKFVSLLLDTGHYSYAGADPLVELKKHIGRVKHMHLKDIRHDVVEEVRRSGLSFLDGVKMGTFTIPGDSTLDYKPIFKELATAGYDGWLLVEAEQDPAKANPLEYACKAKKYIDECFAYAEQNA
jgi:inosose dehydratase